MGVKINFYNKKNYKGELISDIFIKSPRNIKSIKCPSNLNSGAIDEFLVIFLIAAKAKGCFFKGLEELDKKRKPKIEMGIKNLEINGS